MALRIRELDAAAAPAWDRFVRQAPRGSFFHLAGWKRVIEEAFGHSTHFAYAEQDGAIIGVLPLARMKTRLFGDSLISTPSASMAGRSPTARRRRAR